MKKEFEKNAFILLEAIFKNLVDGKMLVVAGRLVLQVEEMFPIQTQFSDETS